MLASFFIDITLDCSMQLPETNDFSKIKQVIYESYFGLRYNFRYFCSIRGFNVK